MLQENNVAGNSLIEHFDNENAESSNNNPEINFNEEYQYDPALDEDDTQSIPGEPFYAGQQEAMIAGEFDYLDDMEIDDG